MNVQPPFRDAGHLLGYLGRYLHRIAISDSRLREVTPDKVTFTTRKGGRLEQARALLEQQIDPVEAEQEKAETAEILAKLTFAGHRCPVCDGIMVPMNVRLPRLRAPPGETNA